MSHPLDGARAKVARAAEHREAMSSRWRAFIDTEPYGLTAEFDSAASDEARRLVAYSYRFTIREPVPHDVLTIAGDVVHNLRSALDYIASELVSFHSGKREPRHAQFPIHLDRRSFNDSVRDRPRKRGPGPLDGIPTNSDAWVFIEQAQPYQLGDEAKAHPLYSLNVLSNRDKHRMLNPAVGSALLKDFVGVLGWNIDAMLHEATTHWVQGMPLEDGTKVVTLVFDQRGAEPKVSVTGPILMDTTFRGDGGEGACAGFASMFDYVSNLVDDAAPLFDQT